MSAKGLLKRLLIWRIRNLSDSNFIIIASIIVGITVGLVAVVIKNSVHVIQNILTHDFFDQFENILFIFYPLIGIAIAVLITKYILRRKIGHGIPMVLYAISKKQGKIDSHNMFSSIIASAFTVGFGGSVGLEGPTIVTGAAYGSAYGKLFHLNHKQTNLLLTCACTGAMAAIFQAPIAAIVFAIEVIMLNLTLASLIITIFSICSSDFVFAYGAGCFISSFYYTSF